MKARDVCELALAKHNIIAAGDSASGTDAVFVLTWLNLLLDSWNTTAHKVYDQRFPSFTLTANLQPHTIGIAADSPTFATNITTNRPQTIDGAVISTGSGTTAIRHPLTMRDREWWMNQRMQAITTTIPSDLYYDPGWPNGSIYLWPVPTVANTIELMIRRVLAQLVLTDTFTLPPGYALAIILTLAEMIAPDFERTVSAQLAREARNARAEIFGANSFTPRIATADAGTGGRGRHFNIRTGMFQ